MERSQKNRISILFDRDHLKVTLSVFILIFCEFFFLRNIIFSDRMMGDLGDGRLTMLLADHYDIMTINGYAGKPPLGWGAIERPFEKGYEEAALKWIKDHNIKGAYRYDKPTKEWIKITY